MNSLARAQDSPDEAADRETRLKSMQQIADRFKVQTIDAGKLEAVPLIAAPLLRFNDPAREFHDATLWGWGETGRPLCLLAIEQYGDRSWFECISLSAKEFSAEAETLRWRPKAPGLELQVFPNASSPASKAPRRLAQMKELLGQLAVHEVGRTGSRYELRLLPKPLHRYDDAASELRDGAIFAFAYGTNPELLGVIEARGKDATSAQWMIGFVRCGTAEPYVMLQDKELFHLPYAKQTTPENPYWNFSYQFADDK
jgi:hypothetical protein